MRRWRSGLTHHPFTVTFAGSNPARRTNLIITECGGIGKRVERGRLEGNLTI